MSFTIRSILNKRDVSPRRRAQQDKGSMESKEREPAWKEAPARRVQGRQTPGKHAEDSTGACGRSTWNDGEQDSQHGPDESAAETVDLVSLYLASQSQASGYDPNEPLASSAAVDNSRVLEKLLNHAELIHEVSSHLDVDDLVNLYSISKEYHAHANARFTTLIMNQATQKAPESARIFAFKCYNNLCQFDPGHRPNEEAAGGRVRDVPTFRWLRMILFREQTVGNIVRSLAMEGQRVPRGTKEALKKVWFLMDVSDNARRIGLVHNRDFFTNRDLFLATMFQIKLDMRLSDPMDGRGHPGFRHLLLAQRTLAVLDRVLRRQELLDHYDLMQMYVEWAHVPRPVPAPADALPIAGVAPERIGLLSREGWSPRGARLLRPDELVMREAVRRKLGLEVRYLDMMLWGNIDEETGEDIWPLDEDDDDRRRRRRRRYRHEGSGEEGEEEEDDDDDDDGESEESDCEADVEDGGEELEREAPAIDPGDVQGLEG